MRYDGDYGAYPKQTAKMKVAPGMRLYMAVAYVAVAKATASTNMFCCKDALRLQSRNVKILLSIHLGSVRLSSQEDTVRSVIID